MPRKVPVLVENNLLWPIFPLSKCKVNILGLFLYCHLRLMHPIPDAVQFLSNLKEDQIISIKAGTICASCHVGPETASWCYGSQCTDGLNGNQGWQYQQYISPITIPTYKWIYPTPGPFISRGSPNIFLNILKLWETCVQQFGRICQNL